jgi:uncharacterized membrane protein YtjA (UPF0391 family)
MVALVAGIFGSSGTVEIAAHISSILFVVGLILFVQFWCSAAGSRLVNASQSDDIFSRSSP